MDQTSWFVLVFFLCYFVSSGVTIIANYLWDKTRVLPTVSSAAPPFPQATPIVPLPSSSALNKDCAKFSANAAGQYVPSPIHALNACKTEADCAFCTTYPENVPLTCVSASNPAYPLVAQQQAALDNSALAYCLPPPADCISTLRPCTQNVDCVGCFGDIPLTCESVDEPKNVLFGDVVVGVEPGRWCLPRTQACDPNHGMLEWTTDGWSCRCYHPEVMGGPACDTMIACNAQDAVEWSRPYQTLWVNDTTNTKWLDAIEVNPVLCHLPGAPRSQWTQTCDYVKNPSLMPNTVCQCDGLALNNRQQFIYEPTNPLVCQRDPCSTNALGGRSRTDFSTAQWTSDVDVPFNACVCSGADSRLWDSTGGDASTEGYVYRGGCGCRVLPHSVVSLPVATDWSLCSMPQNNSATASSLVPGLFASEADGGQTQFVCAPDPCRAQYADITFNPASGLQSWGHYNAGTGMCDCVSPAARVDVKDTTSFEVNPVGSACVNACLSNPCGVTTNRPCSKGEITCVTNSQGNAECRCPVGCGNVNGFLCAEQFEHDTPCTGWVNVPNICKPADGDPPGLITECRCHKGQNSPYSTLTGSCSDSGYHYAMCSSASLDVQPVCRENQPTIGSATKCGGRTCPDDPGTSGCSNEQAFPSL
jgi:hypothetical protein